MTFRSKRNRFFINGDGIRREVLQREITTFLGPELHSRRSTYNVSIMYGVGKLKAQDQLCF